MTVIWLYEACCACEDQRIPKAECTCVILSYLDSNIVTPNMCTELNNTDDLVQHVQDMHCPDSEVLSVFCNDSSLWQRYDKPIEGIKKVSLLCSVAKMMGLSKDCLDFWKNILCTIVLRPPHAQKAIQTLEVCQNHKAYCTGLTRCTFGIQPGPAPSAFPASLTSIDNLNAVSDNIHSSQKHVFDVTDVEQFHNMLGAATDAMVLNHISTLDRLTVPLDTAELNYISKGLSGALADKVITLISKMPKHIRDQLQKECKCFICKKQGHIAVVCQLLPED